MILLCGFLGNFLWCYDSNTVAHYFTKFLIDKSSLFICPFSQVYYQLNRIDTITHETKWHALYWQSRRCSINTKSNSMKLAIILKQVFLVIWQIKLFILCIYWASSSSTQAHKNIFIWLSLSMQSNLFSAKIMFSSY